MRLLGSLVFTLFLFISCMPFSVLVVLVRPFGSGTSYRIAAAWARLVLWSCRILCGLNFVVEGQEHIPDRASVLFLKHSSAYETLAQLVIFPRQVWVLKRELMWAPFFGWSIACLHAIAINRAGGRSAVDQVIKQGTERLNEGLWVNIFPEGTRMAPGETRRYGVSGTLLAQNAARPIVPVAHNAGDFWPRRGWRKKPGVIRFVIGAPVDPAGRNPREVNDELQAWIETKVAEIRA